MSVLKRKNSDGTWDIVGLLGHTHDDVYYTEAEIDLKVDELENKYMSKSNPTGTGSMSLNRKADSDIGSRSVSMGNANIAKGDYSIAMGTTNTSNGNYSIAMGKDNTAEEAGSIAMGYDNTSSGTFSIAIGSTNNVSGGCGTALGLNNTVSSSYSCAVGWNNTASGQHSFAQGNNSVAGGNYSQAEGQYTIASSANQHVHGKFNIEDAAGTYAHIIGNGTNSSSRSNAHTLDWDGNAWFAGDIYLGGTGQSDANMISDYIVAQGTSGNWTYAKYNSGRAVMTCETSVTNLAVNTAFGGVYRSGAQTLSLPFNITSTSNCIVSANLIGTATAFAQGCAHTTEQVAFFIVSNASSTAFTKQVQIYVEGRWK